MDDTALLALDGKLVPLGCPLVFICMLGSDPTQMHRARTEPSVCYLEGQIRLLPVPPCKARPEVLRSGFGNIQKAN
jgi:hypothetical protein